MKDTENINMYYMKYYKSPLGRMLMSSDGKSLSGLWFEGQKYYASTLPEDDHAIKPEENLPVFAETERWLNAYFQGRQPDFTPPLAMETSGFRKAVWQILLSIPYGQTMTYGQIAEKLTQKQGGSKTSARAVGGAVGHNPISLIIPCHRVVGSDGRLNGYAGGTDKKAKLLALEGVNIHKNF